MVVKPWQTSGQVHVEALFPGSSAQVWSNEFDPTPGMVVCRDEFIRPDLSKQAPFGNYFWILIASKPLLQALPEPGDFCLQVGDALFEFRHAAMG